jgi:Fe-S cluster biogenesis protein NfuA
MEEGMLKDRVEAVLEKVRVGLKSEGGDIELVDVRDNVVYVKLKGACGTCPMSTLTMKNWVETSIRKEIPEIISVRLFNIGFYAEECYRDSYEDFW